LSEETLDALVERRYRALLDDSNDHACEACGRKPLSATQLTQALSGVVRYLSSRTTPPTGGTPGSALRDDDDDSQ
jgi:hypothetical protein